jgi:hypothetical protein
MALPGSHDLGKGGLRMSEHFERVKDYLDELGYAVNQEDPAEELVVITDEEQGIHNLIIDCEDPILVIEQAIMEVSGKGGEVFKRLLQMNRNLIHGAFVLDEEGRTVIFRDTLQIENLDRNELEGTLNSLSLGLAENAEELLSFAKT